MKYIFLCVRLCMYIHARARIHTHKHTNKVKILKICG